MRNKIRVTIEYWLNWLKSDRNLISREQYYTKNINKFATAYVGVRRSGKTIISILNAGKQKNRILYINFEDPLFINNNEVSILEEIVSVYTEEYGQEPEHIVLDEIQNIQNWERWVRKCIETRRYIITITGSSASLLSKEISTTLTGRCIEKKVWPLSFSEFLHFLKTKPKTNYEYQSQLNKYMTWGGFPDVVLEDDEINKKMILMQYAKDIIYRDIVNRYEIRNVHNLEQIANYYLRNTSSLHSYTKLKNAFSINFDTAQEYTKYLNDAFMVFQVKRYHPNLKLQARDPFKIYVVDTGLRNMNAFINTDDFGKTVENIVFLELKRRDYDVFYFKNKYEVDFLLIKANKLASAIQVCYSDMQNKKTYDREIRALLECMNKLNCKEALIITKDYKEIIKIDGKTILAIPLYNWLMEL